MGQKIHPIGFRIGINEDWRSRWYARKAIFSKYLIEDYRIRTIIKSRHKAAMIPRIEIQRQGPKVEVIVHTGKPGMIIGKKGIEVEKLKEQLQSVLSKGAEIAIDIAEVQEIDLEAQLVAENVAEQLQRRVAFRRAIKKMTEQVMQKGARGVKIMVSGRLGGSDMARCEVSLQGSIPLQKLDAKIDYGFTEAKTPYGYIGVKVWIYRGDYTLGDKALVGIKKRGWSRSPAEGSAPSQ